jgi:hypothetical protein
MHGKSRRTLLDRLAGLLKFDRSSNDLNQFEPVYGLTWQALREWLNANPNCREGYRRKLQRKRDIVSHPSV